MEKSGKVNIMKIKRLTAIAAVVCTAMIMSLGGCKKEEEAAEAPVAQTEEETSTNTADTEPQNDSESEEGDSNDLPEGQMRSFLSGLPVDEKIGNRRPVAIMLNNLKPAQPMSGVSYADVVYEYVVEGGITRLMGVFENYDGLDKIGSVRSCREYLCTLRLNLMRYTATLVRLHTLWNFSTRIMLII